MYTAQTKLVVGYFNHDTSITVLAPLLASNHHTLAFTFIQHWKPLFLFLELQHHLF